MKMKKRKSTEPSISSKIKKESTTCSQKSIKNYFSSLAPGERSSSNSFLKVEESDSDIEILTSPFKRKNNDSDDDVIIVRERLKKVKVDRAAVVGVQLFEDSSKGNLNTRNLQSSVSSDSEISSLTYTRSSAGSTKKRDNQENEAKDFELNDLFKTPPKKLPVNYPIDIASPSPYYKNISDTVNVKSFKDISQYLHDHLEDISKVKTPTKSDTKKRLSTNESDTSSARRELSFSDSPTKSDAKEQKLNLTNKKELTYSEINRKNFDTILKKVIDDPLNRCLFNDDDWKTISMYTSLSNDSQSLFLRLFFRKNSWIKRALIKYDDLINNLDELLDELLKRNFLIDTRKLASLEEALYILEPNEVKEFANQSKVNLKGTGKKNMIESILHFARTTNTLTFSASKMSLEERKLNELKKRLGNRCVKVNMDNAKVFLRILLLYFPPIYFEKNLNMTLSETFFNLYNNSINLSTFPSYNLNKTVQVYTTREELVLYSDACILESMINENSPTVSSEIGEYIEKALLKYEGYVQMGNLKLDMNLPYFLRKLTAGQKLLRCISQCVSLLEKNKCYEEANKYLDFLLRQNVYCLSTRGKWYDRLIVNYESHLKDEQKAYEYCMKAFEDYYVRKAIKLVIQKKSIRLAKKLKINNILPFPELKTPEFHICANTVKRKVDLRNNLFCELNEDGFTVIKVEQVALNYYADELSFTKGLHSENALFNNLFFLLFYDQIFIKDDKIKDIYRYDFQKLPLDFGTDSFYEVRREHFEARFDQLSEMGFKTLDNLIESEYEKHKNVNTIINFDSIKLKNLKEIIYCLNIDTLLNICRRLAEDNRFSRSGFPDLIVWNYEERKIKAVEVKGPGDSLSEKQLLWIDFLNKAGLESEVCYVKAKK